MRMNLKNKKIPLLGNTSEDIVLNFKLPNSCSVREIRPDIKTDKSCTLMRAHTSDFKDFL